MGISLFEMDIVDYPSILFGKVLPILFEENAVENIEWWIWEKRGNSSLKMYIDDKEIPTETIDDLWEIVKDERK